MVNPGRDFPITCRCMRTKIGIKCKFNESPVLCQRLGLGVANPDGKFGLRFQKYFKFDLLKFNHYKSSQLSPKIALDRPNSCSDHGFWASSVLPWWEKAN